MTEDRTPAAGPQEPAEAADLRRRAEARLAGLPAAAAAAASLPEDASAVVNELRTHQIELEMQNDELRRMQLDLEEQRARYARLFDHSPAGYLTLDDEGRVADANLTAAHLLGVELEHLVGRLFTAFIAAADQDVYYLHHRQLEQDDVPWSSELRLRRAGADEAAGDDEAGHFWVQVEEQARDAGGERLGYSVSFADVHERVIAQQALRQRERESSTLVDNAPDIIARFDTDLRYVSCNAAVEKELGIPARTLIGKSPAETGLPQAQAEQLWRALRQALATVEEQQVEQSLPTPSGEMHFATRIVPELDAQGRIESLLAISRDISARKHAEEALAESEQLFRLTFEQSPIGAALAGPDFRFRRVNARFAEMTGYSAAELLERGFRDITHPDDVAADSAQVRRLAAGEIEEYAREKRYVRKDGGIAWGDIVVHRVEGSGGETMAFVALVNDISARKRAEEERERLLAVVADERRHLAGLIDSISDEIWFADARGRFTMANPAALREFGAGAADDTDVLALVAGLEILRPDGTPRPLEEAPPLRALRGEVVRNLEEIVRAPGSGALRNRLVNSTPVVDDAGSIVGSVSTVRDITDMRRAERAARSEREKAQSYLDIAGVMLVAIGVDQRVLLANRKTCEVLGRSEAEIVGADWFDATLPEAERKQIRAGFAQLMADNVAPWEYVENRIVTSSGDERLIAWHNTVLRDEDGTIVATLSSGEDITERKQTERLLAVPAEILAILAAPTAMAETVDAVVAALKRATGFDAVGLRLQEGEDFPFLGAIGYSDEFLRAEDSLAVRYADGGLCRNADGSISLECTCGLIVTGETDPTNPLFTAGGSAWTNDSLPFLEVAPEDDPRLNPRNTCIHVGFRSLALVPLRAGDEILGLLHLADRQTDRFTAESVGFFEGLGASIGVALSGKRAEEQIRKASLYARSLIEANLDPLVMISPDGKITDVNEATEQMTGLRRELLVGTEFSSYFTRPAEAEAGYWQVLGGGLVRDYPLTIRHASGAVTDVLYNATVYRDERGDVAGVFATAHDITVRKRAEQALRESSTKYRILADNTYDWEWWLAPDLSYEYVSPGCERVTGYAAAEFLADPGLLDAITHPDDRAAVREHLSEGATDQTENHELVFRVRTAVGEERVVEHRCNPVYGDDGTYLGRRGSNRDITERRRAVQALQESQEQLHEAHRLAHIGAWTWHAGTDTVTWTDELFRIAGRDPAGNAPSFAEHAEFIAAESLSRLQAAVENALEAGEPYELEVELALPDGTVRWARALGTAIRGDQGGIEELRGTFQDITEYKLAADEIKRLNAELQERVVSRTEQLDAATRELEALAYSMAHDVRAPLRSIDGFSALVMDD